MSSISSFKARECIFKWFQARKSISQGILLANFGANKQQFFAPRVSTEIWWTKLNFLLLECQKKSNEQKYDIL